MTAGLTAIVPKYTMATQAEVPEKALFSAKKPHVWFLGNNGELVNV